MAQALQIAKSLRWVSLTPSSNEGSGERHGEGSGEGKVEGSGARRGKGSWGFDAEEYELLDNPLNADMHEVPRQAPREQCAKPRETAGRHSSCAR